MLGVTRVSTLSDVEENSSSFDGDPLATVDKTMRSIDEGKVHDCKEDMDTLLVFAGLYSAVLTSFLVQSYQNLLEDPQQVTVNLLRQISLQTSSYELTNGFLTSTVSPASPPTPFQAAGADIRINVCWFASLILSLSTASFGILVKQWLREYLAIDRTVPQERLRILYFRARGLEQWRLYDIAAALPLMLQLSLALFFVGLCFFTGEIHPAVRATSLCLVGGWAILFGFAFVAPLVSARCPYKTTFLKSAFRRARPRVRAFVMSLTRLGRQLLLRSHSPMLHSLCRVTSTIKKVGRQAVLAVRDCLRAADYEAQMERNDQTFADNAVAARHSDLARHNHHVRASVEYTPASLLDDYQIILRVINTYALEDTAVFEEEDAQCTADNDLVIFKHVDAILLDDRVLVTIREAFRARPPSGRDALRFVCAALSNRLSIRAHGKDSAHVFLKGAGELSSTAYIMLTDILTDVLRTAMANATAMESWSRGSLAWLDDAIRIVIALASPRAHLSETATSLLRQCLRDKHMRHTFAKNIIAPGKTTEHWQSLVFMTLTDALKSLGPSAFRDVVHWGYVSDDETVDAESYGVTYNQILDQIRSSDGNGEANAHSGATLVTSHTLHVLVRLACSILNDLVTLPAAVKASKLDASMESDLKDLLLFAVGALYVTEHLPSSVFISLPQSVEDIGLDEVAQKFRTTPLLLMPLLECLEAWQDAFYSVTSTWGMFWRGSSLRSMLREEKDTTLSILADYLERTPRPRLKMSTAIRLYFSYLDLPLDNTEEDRILWRRISLAVAKMVEGGARLIETSQAASHEPPAQSDRYLRSYLREEMTHTQQRAYIILSAIDRDDKDREGTQAFRIGRPSSTRSVSLTDREREIEDAQYERWAVQFDPSRSFYPDELITVLARVSYRMEDTLGRTRWRIRRLGLGVKHDAVRG